MNTASKCGFTPQYEGLEALYKTYGEEGLTIIAVPSNQFAEEEPESNEEVQSFCKLNYGVTFPVMAKSDVRDKEGHVVARFEPVMEPKDMIPAIEALLGKQEYRKRPSRSWVFLCAYTFFSRSSSHQNERKRKVFYPPPYKQALLRKRKKLRAPKPSAYVSIISLHHVLSPSEAFFTNHRTIGASCNLLL